MKKSALVAIAAALSMAMMTGCSGGGNTSQTAASSAAEKTEAAQTEDKETEAAGQETSEGEKAEGTADLDPDSRLAKVLSSGKIVMGTAPGIRNHRYGNFRLRIHRRESRNAGTF